MTADADASRNPSTCSAPAPRSTPTRSSRSSPQSCRRVRPSVTVLARRAIFALMFADLDAADALFRRAMPMAADDPRLRIAIDSGLAGIGYLSWRGWRRARLDMFLALRLAQELGDRALELQALGHTATWVSSLGRPWRHLLERADVLDLPLDDVPLLEHPDPTGGKDSQ